MEQNPKFSIIAVLDTGKAAPCRLSSAVARELADIAARPTNAEIVKRLKTRDRANGPSTADILDAIAEEGDDSHRRGKARIVIDSSAMIEALVGQEADTELLISPQAGVHAPHLLDVEVLRRCGD